MILVEFVPTFTFSFSKSASLATVGDFVHGQNGHRRKKSCRVTKKFHECVQATSSIHRVFSQQATCRPNQGYARKLYLSTLALLYKYACYYLFEIMVALFRPFPKRLIFRMQQVAQVLMTKGRLTLSGIVHFTSLPARTVREALVVMIQHNVCFYTEAREGIRQVCYYSIGQDETLMRLRIGRIIYWAGEWFGKEVGIDNVCFWCENLEGLTCFFRRRRYFISYF